MWAGLSWLIKDSIAISAIELVQVGRGPKGGGKKRGKGPREGRLLVSPQGGRMTYTSGGC